MNVFYESKETLVVVRAEEKIGLVVLDRFVDLRAGVVVQFFQAIFRHNIIANFGGADFIRAAHMNTYVGQVETIDVCKRETRAHMVYFRFYILRFAGATHPCCAKILKVHSSFSKWERECIAALWR